MNRTAILLSCMATISLAVLPTATAYAQDGDESWEVTLARCETRLVHDHLRTLDCVSDRRCHPAVAM